MNRYLSIAVFLWGGAFLGRCESFSLTSQFWDFRGHNIHYHQASNAATSGPPILLLNGFGVGFFHQERLCQRLLEDQGVKNNIYCIDYLGQGQSWPKDCQDGNSVNERGLAYSADMWIDQLVGFIEEIIIPSHDGETKVHLVGNSVGGYLAAHLACYRPDLVESIVLLNPTPVWGLNLPFWDGHLPPPAIPRRVGRYLFDKIRDLDTIETYLQNAYYNTKAFDKRLMKQIRSCTTGTGGHAAFASIMWSPPLKVKGKKGDFQDCLALVECDVLLVFGRDDPWCRPGFGKTMLETLEQRRNGKHQHYVEIENAGHCPNHEAPQAVAQLVASWTGAKERENVELVSGESAAIIEPWGKVIMKTRGLDNFPVSTMDKIATTFV